MSGKFQLEFSTLEHEVEYERLPVKGKIPERLSGTLIRNGPAKFEVGGEKFRHWFDGYAMLHKFSFKNGEVYYTNKFLQSQAYKKAIETGRISFSEFATAPTYSILGRFLSMLSPQITDNANVNIARIGDRFVALTESPTPVEFDPRTLDTIGVFTYEDMIPGHLTPAHPHYDFDRREIINYITLFSLASKYILYRILEGKKQRTLISIVPAKEPAYMHSFSMTENYIILAEFPLIINHFGLLFSGKSFVENLSWKPEKGTRFIIINKKDGRLVGTYIGAPFFAFHHVNAFEKEGEIVVDIVAYSDASVIDTLYLEILKERAPSPGELLRCHITLRGGSVIYEVLSEESLEFPSINYRGYNTKDYRYVYGVGAYRPSDSATQLVKIDISENTSKAWFEKNCFPGEPVFVPAPGSTREDGGVILSVVLDGEKKNSFLLILDASNLYEIARAEIPHHIPFGIHGQYFEDVG